MSDKPEDFDREYVRRLLPTNGFSNHFSRMLALLEWHERQNAAWEKAVEESWYATTIIVRQQQLAAEEVRT